MATDSPRFSIVVPVIGEIGLFEQTLAVLLRDCGADTEVVLVHDGTYQDPHGLAGEVMIVDAQSRRLALMLNRAIECTTGDLVGVVRPSIELPEDWQSLIASAFEDPAVASVAPVIVARPDPDEIVAAGVGTNFGFQRILVGDSNKVADRVLARLRPIGPTQWAGFYRRSALRLVGEFDVTIEDQYLDLDIALTFRNLGFGCQLASACQVQIARAELITRQADQPHGLAAQRSIARHGRGESSTARGLFCFAREVCLTPLQPSLFFQAVGRLGAVKSRPGDLQFAKRIQQIRRTKLAIEKSGMKVVVDDVAQQLDHDNQSVGLRRAA